MKLFLAILLGVSPITASAQGVPPIPWAPHDSTRPPPPVVRPAPGPAGPWSPPSDAIVLFGGTDLSSWRAPRDSSAARWRLRTPAYVKVIHNGVLVQDHVPLTGPTAHRRRPPYEAHPDRLPLRLQDHGQRVRFRNIWIRNLEGP